MNDNQKDRTIDLREIFAVVFKRKWSLIIPLIIATMSAYGGSYLLETEYESSTIIWIDKPASVSRELMDIIGDNSYRRESSSDRVRKLAALNNEIKSQTYLFQLVKNLKLDEDLSIVEQARKLQLSFPQYPIEKLKLDILYEKLRKKISLEFVGADQIKLSVLSNNPVMAQSQVTELTEIMEKEKTKYDLEKILDNQNFADLQLEKTELYYQQAVDSLTQAQTKLSEVILPIAISSEKNRHNISSDIIKFENEIKEYRSQLTTVRNELTGLNVSNPKFVPNSQTKRIRTEVSAFIASQTGMVEKYKWNSQNVITLNIKISEQVDLLSSNISKIVEKDFSNFGADQRVKLKESFLLVEKIEIDKINRDELQESFGAMLTRINLIPKIQAQISELENRVGDARKYRDAFKSEEITVQILSEQARERTKYKVIEPANIPLMPVSPNRTKISILGIILGLVIGGVLVLMRELFDTSFNRVEDVENHLGLSVIAVIPDINKSKVG